MQPQKRPKVVSCPIPVWRHVAASLWLYRKTDTGLTERANICEHIMPKVSSAAEHLQIKNNEQTLCHITWEPITCYHAVQDKYDQYVLLDLTATEVMITLRDRWCDRWPTSPRVLAYEVVIVDDCNKVTFAWASLDCLIIHIINHLIFYLSSTTFRMFTPNVTAATNITVVTWLNTRMFEFLHMDTHEWGSLATLGQIYSNKKCMLRKTHQR